MDWLRGLVSALGDGDAWRLLTGIARLAAESELVQFSAVALPVWLLLHVLLKERLAHRLIGQWPTPADTRRDIVYTLSSFLVFAMLNTVVVAMEAVQRVEIYTDPMKHGLFWLVASLPLLVVWQDTYFYWSHRLLHTRWLFRRVHFVHHRSRNPSPWTGYAFHPLEALNYSVMLMIAIAAVPLNEAVLMIFLGHQIIRNTVGHAAVETMPASFARHRFWRHFTTTTHHHMHHESARGNYGLWFTWWDRWCGTQRADYFECFDKATAPKPLAEVAPPAPPLADPQVEPV